VGDRVDGAFAIEGTKRRAAISQAKQPFLYAAGKVIRERRDYWPLTVRQIHYALLNDPPLKHASKPRSVYANDNTSYKNLTDLLIRARIAGRIPWEAVDDETRPVVIVRSYRDPAPFLREQLDDFLKGYYRDLQQSQPNHIEIVGEKNTILNVVEPVALEYCIPLTIGRGYSSGPPRRKMFERFKRSGRDRLILLFLSDFDPEGEDIAHSFARSMRDDFGIRNIEPIKVALTAEQVLHLNVRPQRIKGGSRAKAFARRHGSDVYELEAVPPGGLQEIVREGINSVLDVDAFNAEVDAEKRDWARLDAIRRVLSERLGDAASDLDTAE
jgi:hypothetical protein